MQSEVTMTGDNSHSQSGVAEEVLTGIRMILRQMGLDTVKEDVITIKTTLQSVQQKQEYLQQSLAYTQQEQDATKQEVKKLQNENNMLQQRINFTENRMTVLEKQLQDTKSRMIENQARSMKENIILHGIKETKGENIRAVVVNFFQSIMKIDPSLFVINNIDLTTHVQMVWIHNCHRLGQPGSEGTIRPIVVNLIEGKDIVLRHSRNLKGTPFYVSSQMPPEIAENKKKLNPMFKTAKQNGKSPKFIRNGDSLLLDGKVYQPPKIPLCCVPATDIINNRKLMNIHASEPIMDKGNSFVAHIATVTQPGDIPAVISAIKNSNHRLATATHNMVAARVSQGNAVQQYSDDDGEHGGAYEIMKELQNQNILNRIIMVTRWASGTQLGKKRFTMINQCTRNILQLSNPTAHRTPPTSGTSHHSPQPQQQDPTTPVSNSNMGPTAVSTESQHSGIHTLPNQVQGNNYMTQGIRGSIPMHDQPTAAPIIPTPGIHQPIHPISGTILPTMSQIQMPSHAGLPV